MEWKNWPRIPGPSQLDMIQAGDHGPPVVLIHGVGLRADTWGAQIETLAQDYRVYAFDTPGRGGSAPVGENPTLADYTDRFAEAIATLDEPALVAGHSMGALIVLDLGIRYPALVSGVAALNGVFRRSDAAKKGAQGRAADLTAGKSADLGATLPRWFGDTPNWRLQIRDGGLPRVAAGGRAYRLCQGLYRVCTRRWPTNRRLSRHAMPRLDPDWRARNRLYARHVTRDGTDRAKC